MKFYGHFAAAYGTIWLLLTVLGFITERRIDVGYLGSLLIFPVIAGFYASTRLMFMLEQSHKKQSTDEVKLLSQRLAELEHEIARRSIGDS